ncbi:MAG: hypothetical protein HC812_08670 [Leptolyngbya sp. RL_3_1]|nr:hypothetical protein [Leptolyngbya sp. RL_3_1]
MQLGGSYAQRTDSLASGDQVIAATGNGIGTATYTYQGVGGVYNLYANYFDSAGGEAEAEVLLNGNKLSSWKFDQDDNGTHERTLGLDVTLKQGDVIKIQSQKDGGDQAIIDYLMLEDAATAERNSGEGVIRVEAEHMTLTGKKFKIEDKKDFASGGGFIQNEDKKGASLTATTTFTGTTGLYNIVIGYYDLEDGNAQYTATLAGEMLDSWIANRDIEDDLDESATTRTLSRVLLNTGDTFSLQSIRDDKDKGYIDYVEFVAVGYEAPETLKIEVEAMDLAGKLGVKSEKFASGGRFVEASDETTGFTGTSLFRGETGYYDIVVGYYDSNKGAAEMAIKVDNAELDRWYADQDLGSDIPEFQTFTTRTVAQGIRLTQFDLIELIGIEDNGDKANLDYIQFIKVNPPAAPAPVVEVEVDPDSDNGDVLRGGAGNDTAYGGEGNDILYGEAGNDILYGDFTAAQGAAMAVLPSPIRVEAENMTLGGDYSFENQGFASGGGLIRTNTSLKAATQFNGPAGRYDIVIGYYDESDGTSPVTVTLDGTTLDSWTFNQNLGNNLAGADNFVTRTVGSAVSLTTGAMLQLQASRNASEFARIDYVEFIAVGAVAQR